MDLNFSKSTIIALIALSLFLPTTGCNVLPSEEAQAQSEASGQRGEGPVAVETAIAETGSLEDTIEYTGTTQPVRLVSLRSQAEGRLVDLTVDIGDAVTQGQRLGQIDDRLLVAQLNQAEAELAALQSEVAQAESEVSDARAQVDRAQAELQQAQADAERLQSLFETGAGTEQAAEQARTAVVTAEQAVRSAIEQVRTRQQAVIAAQGRVEAQRSVVSEENERRQYSLLTSPINGAVLERITDPGNLVQPGDEVLTLGDFSAIKVIVQVSELELAGIRTGQPVQIKLDAFPNQELSGQVSRISPAADPTARLVPIEITMPNPGEQIGSGLLARVQFQSPQASAVVIPETALTAAGEGNRTQENATGENAAGENQQTTLFVVEGEGETAKVLARPVQIGDRANGQVEIRAGLKPGEVYVARSSGPLEDGQPVRLSILSETVQ